MVNPKKSPPQQYRSNTKMKGEISPQLIIAAGILVIAAMASFTHQQMDARINMARTHANFTGALRIAQNSLNARTVKANSHNPTNTGEWIELFNAQSEAAPGGGPAFIVNTKGNSETGAIGVSVTNFGSELQITRPAYVILAEHKSIVQRPQSALEKGS